MGVPASENHAEYILGILVCVSRESISLSWVSVRLVTVWLTSFETPSASAPLASEGSRSCNDLLSTGESPPVSLNLVSGVNLSPTIFFFLLSRFRGFFLLGADWISYPCHLYLRSPKSQHHPASERVNLPSYRSLSYTSSSSSSSSPSFIFFLEGIIYQFRWEWPYIESLPHMDFFSPSPFLRFWSRLDLPPVHNRKGRRNCLWTLFESFSEAPSPARAGHIIFQINFDGLYCLQLIVKFLSDTLHCQWILKSTILNRCQRF